MPGQVFLRHDPDRDEAELREYLGAEFVVERLWRYQETLDTEFAEMGDEERFYRTSRGYLYNLTAFGMTGTKLPYLQQLTRHVPKGARVLDYGCGIGSDGLLLLEAGYRVEFADFANPSTEFLRWRLAWRGLTAPIHDLDGDVPGGFDVAFAFDVIEHVEDPFAFLSEMERRARLVEVNFLEPEPGDQALHRELPVQALVAHAASGHLHHYRVHHGRSHLVIYDPRPPGQTAQIVNRARVLAAGLRMPRGGLRARRP